MQKHRLPYDTAITLLYDSGVLHFCAIKALNGVYGYELARHSKLHSDSSHMTALPA